MLWETVTIIMRGKLANRFGDIFGQGTRSMPKWSHFCSWIFLTRFAKKFRRRLLSGAWKLAIRLCKRGSETNVPSVFTRCTFRLRANKVGEEMEEKRDREEGGQTQIRKIGNRQEAFLVLERLNTFYRGFVRLERNRRRIAAAVNHFTLDHT